VDPKRFPKGFKPISDYAHAHRTKILVWFEPERVAPGTWLYENRREWLLCGSPANDSLAGLCTWSPRAFERSEPCVSCNPTPLVRTMSNIRWEPGCLSFHPGPNGEYSVVRWTAPEAGEHSIHAAFSAIDPKATTDVHVLHRGQPLFDGWINLHGEGKRVSFDRKITVAKGDVVDFVVGWGNGSYFFDSTGLDARVQGPSGKTYDAAKEFDAEHSAAGVWSYGWLKPGPSPQITTFLAYDRPGRPGAGTRLLNLGEPAARQWLTDHVDKLLTEQGIDLYRQDFNMDPLDYWRQNDPPDRRGITEIKHVTGYLTYWDELRRRHPNMLIDSCASGGRRNDLETMRRAVPLWRSDYAFEPNGHQCMTYGISMWIPFQGTGTVATKNAPYYGGGYTDVEPYYFWSNASPSIVSGIDMRVKNINYDLLRKLLEQWRQIGPNYYGDFYPLTPWTRDSKVWMAWQFDRPDKGQGAIQAFRRADCPASSTTLKLRALDPSARYTIVNLGTGNSRVMSGTELINSGLTVQTTENPPVAVTLTYSKMK
jgi:alpha-galactosidase